MKTLGSTYNWLDIAILAILAISIIVGLFRGFLREAISLIAWVVAIFVALKYATLLSVKFTPYIETPTVRYILAFVAIFLAVIIIGVIISGIISLLVSKVGLGFIDRVLGVVFGFLRGVLLVAVLIMLIDMSPLQKQNWITTSRLTPYFNPIVDWLNKFLPAQIKQVSEWMSGSVKNISLQYNTIEVPNVRNSGNNSNPTR